MDPDHLRVVRADKGAVLVLPDDAPDEPVRVPCSTATGSSRPLDGGALAPTVGDWLRVERARTPRLPSVSGARRTALVRDTAGETSRAQALAANIDVVLVVEHLDPDPDLGRVERLLTLRAGAPGRWPLVVLTKADLVPDPTGLSYLVEDVETSAPGVQVLAVSSATGEGIDVLSALVAGGTSVLLGVSGAGKSTLANALLGEDVMEVQATRDADGKGRHTTTTRNLLVLPGGGVLIDTPGLRGVGLWRRRGRGSTSPRSRSWPRGAGSTTAPSGASRVARCSPRWTAARCPSGGSTAGGRLAREAAYQARRAGARGWPPGTSTAGSRSRASTSAGCGRPGRPRS